MRRREFIAAILGGTTAAAIVPIPSPLPQLAVQTIPVDITAAGGVITSQGLRHFIEQAYAYDRAPKTFIVSERALEALTRFVDEVDDFDGE